MQEVAHFVHAMCNKLMVLTIRMEMRADRMKTQKKASAERKRARVKLMKTLDARRREMTRSAKKRFGTEGAI